MPQEDEFDGLRSLSHLQDPDPRNLFFVRWDSAGEFLPLTVKEQHADVASVTLHAGVPDLIATQLETTKNLYLYSWFVYRFHPVAEHHALTCLEFALKTRFSNEIRAGAVPFRGNHPTLPYLLRYAIASGVVKNEGFESWHDMVRIRARHRVEKERFRKMRDGNIERMIWKDSEVVITEEDRNTDYVGILLDTIPTIRNAYAHGSPSLDNGSLHTIRIVAEIINQLFPQPAV